MTSRTAIALLLLAAAACREPSVPAVASDSTWYRAVVSSDEGEVPFFISLPPESAKRDGIIANGVEEIAIVHTWSGPNVTVDFPIWNAQLSAVREQNGDLTGHWIKHSPAFPTPRFAFRAHPVAGPRPELRFPSSAKPGEARGDLSGTWRVSIDEVGVAKGTFRQSASGELTGTMFPSQYSDFRYMAGMMDGRRFQMSTFDGQHAYLVSGELDSSGENL